MLYQAIGDSLPMAVGIALSPIPVAAVAAILLSDRSSNGFPFLLGWLGGILLIGLISLFVPGLRMLNGDPTRFSGWVRIALGIVLLAVAAWKWRRRPSTAEPPEELKILARIDGLGPVQAGGLGALLAVFNPKGMILTFAGTTSIYASKATPKEQIFALALFTCIASMSVAFPVICHLMYRERVEGVLAELELWLVRYNSGITSALLIVFGALLVGNGLKIL